ncbi:MAG: TraM recognition domain-containing protein, partial [Dysosmobacter welbionis]
IGLGSRLQVFQSELIKKITTRDEIDLELPGQERCAYFLVTSDQDSTFDFLASLFLSFCFIKLVRYADKNCEGGKLPVPVHVLGEELTACGTIPDLSRRLSVIRSRNISMSCVFQNLAGLQNRYPLNLGGNRATATRSCFWAAQTAGGGIHLRAHRPASVVSSKSSSWAPGASQLYAGIPGDLWRRQAACPHPG